MMLEIYDIEPLKKFFDVIYNTANDILEVRIDSEKLSIAILNKSHVAFYGLEISKDFFTKYDADVESIYIYVEDFYNILKSSKKNDVLTLTTNEAYLDIIFENENNRRVFELPLADEIGASPVPPSIPYDNEFDIIINDLKEPCNDLSKIVKTDRFKMSLQGNELIISAPTDSMTQYSDIISLNNTIIRECSTTVNVDYMQDILKLSKINDTVTLKVGDSIPVTWNITSPDDLVKMNGLIAPIIEEEE